MSTLWQEARNPADGRVYYYNVQTKETQWTKPADLMTPVEVLPCILPSLNIPDLLTYFIYSERSKIHHGRSILQRMDENIGNAGHTEARAMHDC